MFHQDMWFELFQHYFFLISTEKCKKMPSPPPPPPHPSPPSSTPTSLHIFHRPFYSAKVKHAKTESNNGGKRHQQVLLVLQNLFQSSNFRPSVKLLSYKTCWQTDRRTDNTDHVYLSLTSVGLKLVAISLCHADHTVNVDILCMSLRLHTKVRRVGVGRDVLWPCNQGNLKFGCY